MINEAAKYEGPASGPILGWLICEYEIRGLKPQVSHARW
jgi:hypothetical protein